MLLILIVFTSGALSMFIYYYGLKWIMASKATIYELAFPVTAVVLDYFVHGTVLSPSQILGALLIVGSVMQITRNVK
jgi:drug/metabolite transporter (DMT)-like permease